MTRTKLLLTTVLALGAAFLSGCLFVSAPPTGTIEGYVTDHLSGEPVEGATVKAWPMDGEPPKYSVISAHYSPMAVTNAAGYYRLVVPEGLYTVEVRKPGHATSRAVGVKVGSTTRQDFVQKPVFNPDWSLEPPRVTVTGVTEGMTITGPISVTIEARGDNDIELIYAAFGKTPGAAFLTSPRAVYSSTFVTPSFTIDPAHYGVQGPTTFEVVVYDQNDNRTHVIYRVNVARPGAPVPATQPPRMPTPAWASVACAVTLSQKIGYLAQPLDPLAAPAGGNLYVELRWQKSLDDAAGVTNDGYRIYRRLAGEPEFKLIYTHEADGRPPVPAGRLTLPPGLPTDHYVFRDYSPDLAVGVTATYRITYFRIGPDGTVVESDYIEGSATPLPTWDVRLVSPVDEAKDVPLHPTFTWAATPPPGTTQRYRVRIWDTPQGAWTLTLTAAPDATSVTYAGIPGTPFERLQPHRMYQWEVRTAIAYDSYARPTAVSVAVNHGPETGSEWARFPALVHPHCWTFTTGDW